MQLHYVQRNGFCDSDPQAAVLKYSLHLKYVAALPCEMCNTEIVGKSRENKQLSLVF